MLIAILTAIAALPKIFDFIERGVVAIASVIKQIRMKQRGKKLTKAAAKAQRTKDQRDFEKLLRGD